MKITHEVYHECYGDKYVCDGCCEEPDESWPMKFRLAFE